MVNHRVHAFETCDQFTWKGEIGTVVAVLPEGGEKRVMFDSTMHEL